MNLIFSHNFVDYAEKDNFIKFSAMYWPIETMKTEQKITATVPATVNKVVFNNNLIDPLSQEDDNAEFFLSLRASDINMETGPNKKDAGINIRFTM